MSSPQKGAPSDRSSPSRSPGQPVIGGPPDWVPTHNPRRIPPRSPSLNLGAAAPFSLSTSSFDAVPNTPAQSRSSINPTLPMEESHSSMSTASIRYAIPSNSDDSILPSNGHQWYTHVPVNSVHTDMTQNVHGPVDRLNDSPEDAMNGTSIRPENTAVDIPAGNFDEDEALHDALRDPRFLDDFLPGGIFHGQLYLNTNNSRENEHSGISSVPNTDEMPIQAHPDGDRLAGDQIQQPMFGQPTIRNNAPRQTSDSFPASEEYKNQDTDAEGSSNNLIPFGEYSGYESMHTTDGFRDFYWYEKKIIRRIAAERLPLAEALQEESKLAATVQNADGDAKSQDVGDPDGDGPGFHEDFSDDGEVSANPQAESSSMAVDSSVRSMPLGAKRQHTESIEILNREAEQSQQPKKQRPRTGSADGPNSREVPKARDELADRYDPQAPDVPRVPLADQEVGRPDLRAAQSMRTERIDANTASEELTDAAIFSGWAPIHLRIGVSYTIISMETRVAQRVVVSSDKDQFWEGLDLGSVLQAMQEFDVQSRAFETAKNKSAAVQNVPPEPETVRYRIREGDTYLVISMDNHKTHKGVLAQDDCTWEELDLEATIQDIQSLMSHTD